MVDTSETKKENKVKVQETNGAEVQESTQTKKEEPKKERGLPLGTKVFWKSIQKTFTKITDEEPFSRWKSMEGGSLLIDDKRVKRKDTFKIIPEKETQG